MAKSDGNSYSVNDIDINTVFIAGAYTGGSYNAIEENIRLAESFSIALWNKGYGVFCPHLNTSHFEVKATAKEEDYKEFDLKILRCCDAVFALPNWKQSRGAKTEIDEAKKLGKPIFFSVDDLPNKTKR